MDDATWWTCYEKLTAAYGKKPDKAQSTVFFESLQSVPGPVMRLATDKAIKAEAFFPTPATLRTYCDASGKEIQAPAYMCGECHGNTWVDAGAIVWHGSHYSNVVKRCPQCWTLGDRSREQRL
jgi:hypothetical protein